MKSFINNYLNRQIQLQEIILNYLDDSNDQDNLLKFSSYYENEKIREDKEELQKCIEMIASISKNYHRSPNFYHKIEQIIDIFKLDISENFSNMEIFNIFKNNIRILHFLAKEKIIVVDKKIEKNIKSKYSDYFYPKEEEDSDEQNDSDDYIDDDDFEMFYLDRPKYFDYLETVDQKIEEEEESQERKEEKENQKKEEEEEKQKRKNDYLKMHEQKKETGENENMICQLIRNDDVNEFISYVNLKNIKINQKIESSDFETNSFLRNNRPTIIEYAAFFGSIQIFKYLIINKCKIKPAIWIYSIHGMNSEIIHILEEKQINPPNGTFLNCLYEAIKCHHINLSNYICDNYISNIDDKSEYIIYLCMKYKNYKTLSYLFENKLNDFKFLNQIGFLNICMSFNFIKLVHFLMKQKEIDLNLNTIIIQKDNNNERIEKKSCVLHTAIEKNNIEILKLILSNPKIDINSVSITKSIKKEKVQKNHDFNRNDYFRLLMNRNIYKSNEEEEEENNEEIEEKVFYEKEDSVLNMALEIKNVDILNLLLSRKEINPNSKTIVRYPIEKKIEVETALNDAIEYEVFEIADRLISMEGIDINLKSETKYENHVQNEKTALSLLCEKNNMDLIKKIISRSDIDINQLIECTSTSYGSRHQRYYYEDEDDFDDYMYNDDEYNDYPEKIISKKTILHIAIERNEMEMIRSLLTRKDIDVNILTNGESYSYSEKSRETPLFLAIKKSNIEAIQLLLAHSNIDVNKKSIENGSYLQLTSFAHISGCISIKKTALHLSVERENIEIVKLLLNTKNIDVNCELSYNERTDEKKTALHIAILNHNVEIVSLLLGKDDIDVNAKYVTIEKGDMGYNKRTEKTPLFLSIENGSNEITKLLLKKSNIKVNEKSTFSGSGYTKFYTIVVNYEGDEDDIPVEKEDSKEEKTVLQAAIEQKNKEIVALLLSIPEIDVNEKIKSKSIVTNLRSHSRNITETSTTALHIAVRKNNIEIISLLLNQKRIDVNAIDNNGKRPIDLAYDETIKKLLIK